MATIAAPWGSHCVKGPTAFAVNPEEISPTTRIVRRRMRRVTTVVVATCALAGAGSTPALASTVNTRADHAALTAYNDYLKSIVAETEKGTSADAAFVKRTIPGCGGSFTSSQQPPKATTENLGAEIGDDVYLKYVSYTRTPFSRFATKLSALQWSSPHAVSVIGTMINSERALLSLKASELCKDVVSVSSDPKHEVTPDATKAFIKRFDSTTKSATTHLQAFLGVLSTYEASGDGSLLNSINKRVTKFDRNLKQAVTHYASELISDVGLQS